MSWKETSLFLFDPYQDPRTAVQNPVMSQNQRMRFAKMALADTLSGRVAFNRVYGGPVKANPLGRVPLLDTPVPCFAWTK